MTVEVLQTRLPGVGVRYSFISAAGNRLAVIAHSEGTSEIYVFTSPADDEPRAVVELDDDETRKLGAILGGAYERPKIVEDLELALGELAIEWIRVPDTSPAIGHTLAECGFRARTRVTIIAILREPEPVAGAQPGDEIRARDTLVTVGRRGQYPAFRKLLAQGPFPAPDAGRPTEE
jgi:TrkA domain protein